MKRSWNGSELLLKYGNLTPSTCCTRRAAGQGMLLRLDLQRLDLRLDQIDCKEMLGDRMLGDRIRITGTLKFNDWTSAWASETYHGTLVRTFIRSILELLTQKHHGLQPEVYSLKASTTLLKKETGRPLAEILNLHWRCWADWRIGLAESNADRMLAAVIHREHSSTCVDFHWNLQTLSV